MLILMAIGLMIFAGVINGSFVVPSKYMPKWRHENIWFQFVLWSYIILPCLVMVVLVPAATLLKVYLLTSSSSILLIIVGGLFFGIGQLCFIYALELIGLGLGFAINLGVGIGLGSILPLVIQYPQKIYTFFGMVTLLGVILILVSLGLVNYAGLLRERGVKLVAGSDKVKVGKFWIGAILALIAGLSSAGQNVVFSMTDEMRMLALSLGVSELGSANILWPLYLLIAAIPYGGYMLYRQYSYRSWLLSWQSGTIHYHLLSMVMGICAFGGMLLYSAAAQLIGPLGPVVGWPVFLAGIIVTANLWSVFYGEWCGCPRRARLVMWSGQVFMLLAVVVLGYAAILK